MFDRGIAAFFLSGEGLTIVFLMLCSVLSLAVMAERCPKKRRRPSRRSRACFTLSMAFRRTWTAKLSDSTSRVSPAEAPRARARLNRSRRRSGASRMAPSPISRRCRPP